MKLYRFYSALLEKSKIFDKLTSFVLKASVEGDQVRIRLQ